MENIPVNNIKYIPQNTSSKYKSLLSVFLFLILPIILIVLLLINYSYQNKKKKKYIDDIKIPSYNPEYDKNPNDPNDPNEGIIPDGLIGGTGCSIVDGVERCGCPMLYIGGNPKNYRDNDGRSVAPSYFFDDIDLTQGLTGDASLYQQQLACKSIRNCFFERNATSKNRCIPMSNDRCPKMFPKMSLNEQMKICEVGDKAFKSSKNKNSNNIKGCNFNESFWGNTCDEVK
jgi:hypothetical protein